MDIVNKNEEYEEEEDGVEDLMQPCLMEKLLKNKKEAPSKFESYWEKDENDIESWTQEQIENDERKQLLTFAESDFSLVKELLYKNNRSKRSQIELIGYRDEDGYTALHRAAYSNQLDTCRLLMSFERLDDEFAALKQLEKRTEMGWTPLHSAAYWNSYEIVDYFLRHVGANVNAQTSGGQTPLHLCAQQSNCMQTILILLSHPGIDLRVKNEQGETALDIARRASKFNGLFEIAEENLISL